MYGTKKFGEASVKLDQADLEHEAAYFTIDIYDNGDHDLDGIYTLGKVTLNSQGNIATITVGNVTPEVLRELADELEAKIAALVKTFPAKRAFEGRV